MRTEVRIFDYRMLLNRAYRQALDGAGISQISFGSESCYRQLPSIDEADRIISSFDPIRLKLVIPLCFESHFDTVAAVIDHYLGKVGTIAVNDLGMLHYVLRRQEAHNFRIAISAGLFYSYLECPWHNHIIRDEPPKVKQALLQGNFENDWMIDYLQEFAGCPIEIEMPAITSLFNTSTAMRKAGFKLSAMLDGVPISFARACHTCRYYGVSPAKCTRQCLQSIRLKSTHRWDLFEGDVKEIRPVIRQQMPDLLVWGNVIYLENERPFSIHETPAVSQVIVDTRFGADITLIKRKFSEVGVHQGSGHCQHALAQSVVSPEALEFEDTDAIAVRVRDIVARILEIDSMKILPQSHYVEDLAADSLSGVKVMLALEDEFGIEIDEGEAAQLPTVGMTVVYIHNRLETA
jgi:acyl carrier protein